MDGEMEENAEREPIEPSLLARASRYFSLDDSNLQARCDAR